jgi:uncharacterized cupin superfamily protein
MPKIDIAAAPTKHGTGYPPPHDAPCLDRKRWRLGDAAGLTQFGVNLQRLAPGVWSSQRHWHTAEDEFVYVLEGEVVLVTEAGEQLLRAGDCAGFPAGEANGHHLQNRGDREAVLLEVGGGTTISATIPTSTWPWIHRPARSSARTARRRARSRSAGKGCADRTLTTGRRFA